MIPELRAKFNSEFTGEKYQHLLNDINTAVKYPVDFRIAETPIFIPLDFKDEILKACEEITSYIISDEYKRISLNAIPNGFEVPNDPGYPALLALDFAITKDENGKFMPKLIELQGFSSLFFYELLQNLMYRKYFNIPSNFGGLFDYHNPESYVNKLRDVILGESEPENVILLEIEPEKQKTRVDFACCEKWIGVKPVCITKITKEGRELFYDNDGVKTRIERIYNRVIFDELSKRSDLKLNFRITDELDVIWISHPNWFFRISKYTLPFLKSKYVPATQFLSDIDSYPEDLENYVLKPLFSFAGAGVKYEIKPEDLESITDPANYILQKKIVYEPCIVTPDVPAKAELRMLFAHENGRPYLMNNLVRLSKGKMMGVDFNKEKTWVGSSLAYFEHKV